MLERTTAAGKHWGLREGFLSCGGLIFAGLLLQLVLGPVKWDVFVWPVSSCAFVVLVVLIGLMAFLRKRVYAFRFVPTTDNTALRQATMNNEGYATFANLALAPLTLPEGLEAYALLPGDIDDDVAKKVEATVIGKGEAVLLKGTASETYTLTIDNTQTSDVDAANLLAPVLAWNKPLANDTETGNAQYIFDGTQFNQADGTTKVYQKQAILSVPTANLMANYSTVKLTPAAVAYNFIDV